MEAKHKIKLTAEQIAYLSKLPENGLGYQIVDLKLKDGSEFKNKLVFNSMYLQLDCLEKFNAPDIVEIELSKI